jgi:hypothetical protein
MPFQRQSRVFRRHARLVPLATQSFVLISCRCTDPIIQKGQSGGKGGRGSTIRVEKLPLVRTGRMDAFKCAARVRSGVSQASAVDTFFGARRGIGNRRARR